jgi:hypothetical protein
MDKESYGASAAKWPHSSRLMFTSRWLNCREQGKALTVLFNSISVLGKVAEKPASRPKWRVNAIVSMDTSASIDTDASALGQLLLPSK